MNRITRAGTRAIPTADTRDNYITIIKRHLFLMVGVVNVDLVIIAFCTLIIWGVAR